MRRRWAWAAMSIGVLWSGRLIRLASGTLLDIALAGYLFVLGSWLVILNQRAWRGAGHPLRGWKWRFVPTGVALGGLAFVVSGLGYFASARVIGLSPPDELRLVHGLGPRFLSLLGVALASSLLEEWVFRGVLFEALDRLSPAGAISVSAAAFAAYHGSLFQLAPTFLLGVVLAAAVLRFRSLGPAIVAHATFNSVGLVFTALARGVGGLG